MRSPVKFRSSNREYATEFLVVLRGNFATVGKGRKGHKICECCNEVDVYHPKICLAAKERRESVASTKKGNLEEEAWKNKDALARGRE